MQPQLLRALSGFARTLVGDFIWLKSRYADEISQGEELDTRVFAEITSAQITLDPHFTNPVRYAASYLASIPKKPELALELLEMSQSFNPDRFDLLMSEALVRIGYDVPNSSDRLLDIAKRVEVLPDKSKLVGRMKMDDWMINMIAYVRTQEGKQELIEADLVDLLKQTENPARRELIEDELRRVRAGLVD
ncbi:hypothetical protein AGMMS50229_01870 [Campylobacterota bacterium]|nr:hypothetical protein AGMMS50229_01870 [Campylobacterota bacterium]